MSASSGSLWMTGRFDTSRMTLRPSMRIGSGSRFFTTGPSQTNQADPTRRRTASVHTPPRNEPGGRSSITSGSDWNDSLASASASRAAMRTASASGVSSPRVSTPSRASANSCAASATSPAANASNPAGPCSKNCRSAACREAERSCHSPAAIMTATSPSTMSFVLVNQSFVATARRRDQAANWSAFSAASCRSRCPVRCQTDSSRSAA